MYEAYWGLASRPFENPCSAAAYYPSETHQSAFLQIRYGLENHRQAILLAGEAGMGKSLLARLVQNNVSDQLSPVVLVKHAQLPAEQMAESVARDLGKSPEVQPSTLDASLRRIEQALAANTEIGRRAVIIVEDAHLIRSDATWQLMRSLLNLNDYDAGLTMMFVGQTEILPSLARRRDFEQRLDVKCLLKAFSLEETMGYVSHRLKIAGAKTEIFRDTAIERLHVLAAGVPRRINRLADLSLVVGFADEVSTIDAARVESVSRQLLMPHAA